MSTENNTPDNTDDTNLDDFATEFFGQDEAAPEKTNPEVEEVTEDGVDANEDETQDEDPSDGDTTDADEVDDEDASEDEDEDASSDAKPQKKSRFQERIDEITAARKEAERREQAALDRIAALEAKLTPKDPEPTPTQKASDGPAPPDPLAVDDSGESIYPLGEFDPQYIVDLAEFRVDQKIAQREQEAEQAKQAAKAQEAQAELEASWEKQVSSALERYPDFSTKGDELGAIFSDLDPNYGQYLASTLMSMDNGADVLYHLANNPDEAKQIVASGAQRATVALGRLEAQFSKSGTPTPPRKTTSAPPPPPTNRGASAAKGRVAPDTDDLDAFAKDFFKS